MTHDIDDGVNSGLISFETLKESRIIQEILALVAAEGISREDGGEMFRYRFSSHLINYLVYALLDYSRERVDNSKVLAAVIDSRMALPIGFEKTLERDIKKLKKILFKELYQHKQIMRKMYAGKQAIKGLYRAMTEEEKILPAYYLNQIRERNKHRVIADYIASLSDRHALALYNELYGRL